MISQQLQHLFSLYLPATQNDQVCLLYKMNVLHQACVHAFFSPDLVVYQENEYLNHLQEN